MSGDACSPVAGRIEVTSRAAAEARTTFGVAAEETVFPGHYPGFPIFPGVCLIELAHRSALAAPPAGIESLDLDAIDSARFLSPVFPGDRVTAELGWEPRGDGWRCSATIGTDRGHAAKVRLRYREGGLRR